MKKLSTLVLLSGVLFVSGCKLFEKQNSTSNKNDSKVKKEKKGCLGLCKKKNQKDTVLTKQEVKAKVKPAPKWVTKQDSMPYQPSETRYVDLLHTKLEVSFDWEKQFLYGKATLSLKPYFYSIDSLFIDAKGFDINQVALKGDSLMDLAFQYDSAVIAIKLDKEYTRKDKLEI